MSLILLRRFAAFVCVLLPAGCSPEAPAPASKKASASATPTAPSPAPPKAREREDLALNLEQRTVKANVPKPATIQGENGAFTIFSGNNRINIGVGRIMANGTQMTEIPAETKNLTLALSDAGVLTVSRDDAPPAEFKIPLVPAE